MNPLRTPCAAALAILLAACGGDTPAAVKPPAGPPPAATGQPKASPEPAPAPAPKRLVAPKLDMTLVAAYFANEPSTPKSDNEATPAKVALGKQLYTVPLGPDGTRCATCHDLGKHGQDGKPKSGARNAPTTLNAARQFAQFWDYRSTTIEEALATGHGVADAAQLLTALRSQKDLAPAFAAAFPGEADAVTPRNFQLAVAAYLRTLKTRSPFDAYLDGDQKALTTLQKIGLKAFIDVGCTTCHTSRLVGGNLQQKLGVLRPFASEDLGRFAVSGKAEEKHFFKVPTLLNVAVTAPYMHDGRYTALSDVVQVMAQTQLNKDLKPDEVEALVAFLESLTGPAPN